MFTTVPGPGWLGFDYRGVYGSDKPDEVYPWADGEFPNRPGDNATPFLRVCKSRWPGIKFALPAADPRETVDLGRRGVH